MYRKLFVDNDGESIYIEKFVITENTLFHNEKTQLANGSIRRLNRLRVKKNWRQHTWNFSKYSSFL